MAASQVELVANPSPAVSTYRWSASAVGHLNRKNKMTSLPFWMPNHVTRKHQFRLMLIRGVVLRDQPKDDPIGMMLELIPPPPGLEVAFPGGCTITARLLSRLHEGKKHTIEATETVDVVANNLQVLFPELIPASALQNPEFAEGDGPTLLLEVTIQTGVNVAFERMNQAVTSVWSRISSSVSKFVQRATQALGETREEYVASEVLQAYHKPPWDDVPKCWDGRREEWRQLVSKVIVEDEGTFRYGRSKGFSKDEQALLTQCGLDQRAIAGAYAIFDYDRDVHEGLLSVPEIRRQRYNLVPGKLKDEIFWANYFWKVAALGFCTNDDQVRLLLTVLNAPPAIQPRDMSSIRLVAEETVLVHVSDAQEAADMLVEYLTDDAPDSDMLLEAAAEACEGHVRQLEGYFKRADLSEPTLKVIGALLRRIRDRLNVYRERNINRGLLGGNSPALDARDQKRESDSSLEVTENHRPLKKSLVVPEDSATGHSLTEDEADGRLSVPPSPAAEPSDAGAGEDDRASPLKRVDASSGLSANVDRDAGLEFPKMPWEEEDESDG